MAVGHDSVVACRGGFDKRQGGTWKKVGAVGRCEYRTLYYYLRRRDLFQISPYRLSLALIPR